MSSLENIDIIPTRSSQVCFFNEWANDARYTPQFTAQSLLCRIEEISAW